MDQTKETEGVVQFAFDLSSEPGVDPSPDLLAWRELMMRLQLIGQQADRYGGYGFGNLSQRILSDDQNDQNDREDKAEFIISASQSTHLSHENPAAWSTIDVINFERFWIEARSKQPPSSETLTHAAIYAAEPKANWVLHAHNPEIWRNAETLKLPAIAEHVPYGSMAMTRAVAMLLQTHVSRPLVFVTLGHEDGVFALGATARDTGGLLVSYLSKALTL
jgi:ribulose-5-phosphate 4-epimerase/fuculose-1-phosphate aldolase